MYNLRCARRPAPPAVRALALALGTSLFAAAAQAGSVPVTTEFSALTSANRGEFGSAVAVLGERVFVSANASNAAAALGISRSTLYRRMQALELSADGE